MSIKVLENLSMFTVVAVQSVGVIALETSSDALQALYGTIISLVHTSAQRGMFTHYLCATMREELAGIAEIVK